jgi:uncharacterized protein YceH (UPF0502 family)
MALDLDTLEQRVIGALIEKGLTVPDAYPLTLNALVAACNQKSNRDPAMEVEAYEVEGALRALMDRDWVTRREPAGGRTMRYAHEAHVQLAVDEADLAILSELLCRGPQAPGALKTRAARMHPFASPEEVEARLRALAARPVPYVEQLPLQPRERQARWSHRLGRPGDADATAPAEAPAEAPKRAVAPVWMSAAGPAPDVAPATGAATPDGDERLAALEDRMRDLEERLDRIEGR